MLRRLIKHYKNSFQGLSKPVWLLALVLFINRSGSMVLFFLTLYLTRKLDFSVALAARMMSIYGVGALAGAYLGGWLSDRIGYSRVQMLSLFFTGIAYITVILWENIFPVAVNLFILAVLAEAFRPATSTAFAKNAPKKIRSRAFAVQRLAINLGVAIGPALGGFIARYNYNYLFWIDGITCIIAGIMHYFFIHGKLKKIYDQKAKHKKSVPAFIKDRIFLILLLFSFLLGTFFMQIISTWPVYLKEVLTFAENRIGLLLAINTILIVLFEIPLIHSLEKYKKIASWLLVLFCFVLVLVFCPWV